MFKFLSFLFGTRQVSAPQAKNNLNFPDSVTLNDVQLTGNGKGVRKRFGIKIYEMALYLPAAATTAEQVVAMLGPKQLRFVAMRRLSGSMLGAALLNGMRKNLPSGQEARFLPYTDKIVEVIKSQPEIGEGHTFRIDLLPESGAHFYVNDELKGEPIHAPGFNEALIGIWLGRYPADADLKSNLLAGKI